MTRNVLLSLTLALASLTVVPLASAQTRPAAHHTVRSAHTGHARTARVAARPAARRAH